MSKEKELLEKILNYDTPSVSNVVATYPGNKEHCLGLFHPWNTKWYCNQNIKCMYPELGRRAGYVITVTYGMPDPKYDRLTFTDLAKAIAAAPKPVILCIKQDLPEEYKNKNGLLGGNMMSAFKSLGVVGVVSDGPSRDLDEVRPLGIQYLLTGVCVGHGDFSIHAINEPVDICDMVVSPLDIVHMDENGAVKFPKQYLEQVVENCEKLQRYEEEKQSRLLATNDPEEIGRIMSDVYR